MRFILILLAAFTLSLSSCNSPKTTAQFYHAHKHKEGVTNFKVPGWLMWMGGGIARGFVHDEQARAGLKMAKKIKKIRLMVAEGYNPIAAGEINTFVNHIRANGYNDLLFVRSDDGTAVHLLAREKKDKLNNLVLMVSEEDEFVYFDIKTRITYDGLNELIEAVMDKDKAPETEAPEPPAEAEEEIIAKKIPQV